MRSVGLKVLKNKLSEYVRPLRRLTLALGCAAACSAPEQHTRDTLQLVEGEAALRARYVHAHRCPSPVPAQWRLRDTSASGAWECSALVASAEAIKEAAMRDSYLAEWGRAPMLCARAIAFRFPELRADGTFSPPIGYWSVEFRNVRGQGARAVIHVPSGAVEVGRLDNEFNMPLDALCRVD